MTKFRTNKHITDGIANGGTGVFMCVDVNRTGDTMKRGWFNTNLTRGRGVSVFST